MKESTSSNSKSIHDAEAGSFEAKYQKSHRTSILLDEFYQLPVSKHNLRTHNTNRSTSDIEIWEENDGIWIPDKSKGKNLFSTRYHCTSHFLVWILGVIIIVISSIVLNSKSNFILAYDYELGEKSYTELSTTSRTEAIRWGFYFTFLLGLYMFITKTLYLIPTILETWCKVVKKQPRLPHSINDRILYYKNIRGYFVFFLMSFGAMVMGMMIFHGGVSDSDNNISGIKNFEGWRIRGWEFYWKKSLVSICVASLFLLLKKWIAQYISYVFHMVHYDDLAQRNNLCLDVVLRLREFSKRIRTIEGYNTTVPTLDNLEFDTILTECFENAITAPEEIPFSQRFHDSYEKYRVHNQEALLDIKRGSITLALNVRTAMIMARYKNTSNENVQDSESVDILNNILGPEDFMAVFSRKSEADRAFRLMDRDGNGDLTIHEMVWFIASTFIQRQNLLSAMGKADSIIRKLENIIGAAFALLLCAILFTIYDLPTSSLATIGTFFLGLSFIFGPSSSHLFQSIVFIFVTHPYDIGDQVYIGNRDQSSKYIAEDVDLNKIIVFDIGLLSTTFLQPTGRLLYVANHILASLEIENVRRAIQQSELISLELPSSTPMTDVIELKGMVDQYIRKESRDFSSSPDLFTVRIVNPTKFKLVIHLQYSKGTQNSGLDFRWQKRNQFHEFLIDCCRKLSMEFITN